MTPRSPSPADVQRFSERLAGELLGGIAYGDSRDDPEWRREVIAAAARFIDNELSAFIRTHSP